MPEMLRRSVVLALMATCLIAVPSHATKRRAVKHPSPAIVGVLTVSGIITDNVTGAPVINARVSIGHDSDTTDNTGKYELKEVTAGLPSNLTVERTGYVTKTISISSGGVQTLNIRVDPTPTVRLRMIDNTVIDLDSESILFGYPVPFSGYREDESEDFCKPDGSTVSIHRSQFRRISGPAAEVNFPACCTTGRTVRINAELKTGEVTNLYFVDACNGFPDIDVKGRNHVTGRTIYTPFKNIAEITFP